MSLWEQHDLTAKVTEVLGAGTVTHHFGRPYLSAYQLAIGVEDAYPETVAQIGKPVGGAGAGQSNSLAQYLALELSRQIKAQGPDHPVEGAFLSNSHVKEITFTGTDGAEITSSLVGAGFDMSMFRLR